MSPAGLAWTVSKHRWQPAPHLYLLNDALMQVAGGHISRLIISMPPRHGKSELMSKYYPAWYLGTFPDRRILLSSYESDFAASWGRKARDVLTEWGHLFPSNVKLRQDSQAANRWDVADHEGGMSTAGVGSSTTGKGAHLFLIDDPVANAEEANSPTYRRRLWDWFQSTAYTRLEPNGAIILCMTRWHEDDLAGRLLYNMAHDTGLTEEADQWVHLSLPAIAEEGDTLGRQTGEALWPARYNVARLAKTRKAVGGYWWAALYQQRPAPAEGETFKRAWFRTWREDATRTLYLLGSKIVPKNTCWRFATMDLAASEATSADYTVIGIWDVTPDNDLILLDVIRDQMSAAKHLALIENVFDRYPTLAFLGVEKVGYQLKLMQEGVLRGWPIVPLIADRDKFSRALVVSARYETGTVYHPVPELAPWLGEYEAELLVFPNGRHDDQVDIAGYAAISLGERGGDVPMTLLH